ncbi:MAG: adenine deaminase [Deltaproteobacteria bacterium]|jgi:adenine deaminase|nr:adenine deaminase [Deltaproteobacteria bacterium]
MPKPVESLIRTALGEAEPDLVVKGARVFDSFQGGFRDEDLAVKDGWIAGIGSFEGGVEVDGRDQYLLPGLIDCHVHLESSLCAPGEFARMINAAGTTSVVCDPHEIANVAGASGLSYILKATEGLPVDVYLMLPSCVPASPIERGGAELPALALEPFLGHPRVLGLGEMMNYPGVLSRNPEVLAKLRLGEGRRSAPPDGHAPGLRGRSLSAYASSGIGSDHESSEVGELSEKISAGLFMLLREGSAAKNLVNLLPAVTSFNSRFCAFATDDRNAMDLTREGGINHMVRTALATGPLQLPELLNMASINGARHYRIPGAGALAPGYRADMALYRDLWSFRPSRVWKSGEETAREGLSLVPETSPPQDRAVFGTVLLGEISPSDLRAYAAEGARILVIGVRDRELLTDKLSLDLPRRAGELLPDPERDIAKMIACDRYRGESKPAVGFIKGLGLRRGALASTVSHDSHNLVAAGITDSDILCAARRCAELQGGQVAVLDGRILWELPLPLAGLMSSLPYRETAQRLAHFADAGAALGLRPDSEPFMTLSFMSLPVIPSLKLTANGLVDVDAFTVVPLTA